mgnify:CR=1 FL=1|jgi:hypothetical protein
MSIFVLFLEIMPVNQGLATVKEKTKKGILIYVKNKHPLLVL